MQNILLCLENLAHRSHECNILTDPLNLSALALPTCMQCVPIFYIKVSTDFDHDNVFFFIIILQMIGSLYLATLPSLVWVPSRFCLTCYL